MKSRATIYENIEFEKILRRYLNLSDSKKYNLLYGDLNDYSRDIRLKSIDDEISLSHDFVFKILNSAMKMLEQYPYREKNIRVGILVDQMFISNHSGIYTFIKHLAKLCSRNGYMLDLITDFPPREVNNIQLNTENITLYFVTRYDEDKAAKLHYSIKKWTDVNDEKKESRVKIMTLTLEDYIKKIKPRIIIANSYTSTLAIESNKQLLFDKKIKFCTYTHIGDLFTKEYEDVFDFKKKEVCKYLSLLKETDMPICTQTSGMKKRIDEVLNKDNTIVLPEPFYEPEKIFISTEGRRGILMIGSNYKRKNYAKMFELISILGFPATVVCGGDDIVEITNLKKLAIEVGVTQLQILTNIPNEYMNYTINRHVCLLHLSKIEILPYAILETAGHIPCIVNKNAPWTDDTPIKTLIKIDPDDLIESLATIQKVYGDPFERAVMDTELYSLNSEKIWKEIIESDQQFNVNIGKIK